VLERLVRVLPAGPLRARTLRVFGWVHDHVDESAALLEQALAEADIEDDALRSEIHYQLCRTMAFQDDWQSSAEHAQAAVDHAERAGDAAALARAIGRAAVIPTMRGRGAALAPIDRALALERSLSTPLRLSESPSTMRGIVLLGEERFGEARDVLDEAYQRALALGDMWRAILLTWLTELEVRAGNWERAAEHALEAEELGGQWGVADGEAWGLYARGLVEAHRGNVAPSRAALDQACALAHSIGNVWVSLRIEAALAFLDLSVGDASAVRRRMQPLLERDAVPARALVDMVEALVVLGDVEQASAAASRLAQRLAEAPLPSLVAGEARSRALSHAAAGDLSAAQTAVAQGLATENRFEEPFERARTLLVAGTIYRRIKRKAEARDALERARDAFERLGATLWVEKVRAELARTGAQRSGSGLTSTERRVAELAARGATNREISGELFMSVKTVEANLSRVYAKLGIRSRTQLASHADAIEGTA
jgi:DNA-binding NarL/FixJ family response regulator